MENRVASVEAGPVRRGRPRSSETEQAILDSAYRIMASEGLAAASIDAVARNSGVSKMTIYKWWPSREALLIDAFLRQAASMLPLPDKGDPLARACANMRRPMSRRCNSDFGKVQLAVIAECIASTGSAAIFSERYLGGFAATSRSRIIKAGQKDGSILAAEPAGEPVRPHLRHVVLSIRLRVSGGLTRDYAEKLVNSVLTKK